MRRSRASRGDSAFRRFVRTGEAAADVFVPIGVAFDGGGTDDLHVVAQRIGQGVSCTLVFTIMCEAFSVSRAAHDATRAEVGSGISEFEAGLGCADCAKRLVARKCSS